MKTPGCNICAIGIAESLFNWLAAQHAVKVGSKSASFHLREEAEDAMVIGERLGVDSVLQGKLEKVGDQVVISVSLVDPRYIGMVKSLNVPAIE